MTTIKFFKKLVGRFFPVLVIMILAILISILASCSKDYNFLYSNTYVLVNPAHLDSLYIFYPERGKYIYEQDSKADRYALDNFEKIKNGDGFTVKMDQDSLMVTTDQEVDIPYFSGMDGNQQWVQHGNTWSLKLGKLFAPTERGYYEIDLTNVKDN